MPYYRWIWTNVRSGQIIRFKYTTANWSGWRVIIVMMTPKDPGTKDKDRLHGLEISRRSGMSKIISKLPMILKIMGGVSLVEEDEILGKFFKVNMGFEAKDKYKPNLVYQKIKSLIAPTDMYKTYSWEKCKKSIVQLDNEEINEITIPLEFLIEAKITPTAEPKRKPRPTVVKKKSDLAKKKIWRDERGRFMKAPTDED